MRDTPPKPDSPAASPARSAADSVSPPTGAAPIAPRSTLHPQPSLFRFGALILAAGASSRLGQPKQLLPYQGLPLVTRAAEAALAAGAAPVVIVLGAHAEKIRPVLAALPVVIAENPAWSEGMASSIRTGLAALEAPTPQALLSASSQRAVPTSPPDAVLIALCDQPHFSAEAIARLRAEIVAGATIAATRHADGTGGVPAMFTRAHFAALHALRGSEGARRIIAAHTATTALVDLPELALDIDTPEDWQRLHSR